MAPLASPDRAAVRTRNFRQCFEAGDVWDTVDGLESRTHLMIGKRTEMCLTLGIDGSAPSMASPAGFASINSFAIAH